ncbi:Uncharacterised protein [Mycobacteroides abscessus]|nr:Uncharacterised protein [Mycobacteroides abscessus]CPZ17365.1 Uncharacterised protein [Mycobacteroides abscessus]
MLAAKTAGRVSSRIALRCCSDAPVCRGTETVPRRNPATSSDAKSVLVKPN